MFFSYYVYLLTYYVYRTVTVTENHVDDERPLPPTPTPGRHVTTGTITHGAGEGTQKRPWQETSASTSLGP